LDDEETNRKAKIHAPQSRETGISRVARTVAMEQLPVLLAGRSRPGEGECGSVLLPPTIAEALRNVPPGRNPNRRYFFWSGASRSSVVKGFGKAFRRLVELADIRNSDGTRKRCHPHMLRDTFAVENLLAEIPIDQVSKLLGHSSVKITEKHYAPWVPARQQQLENSVRKALMAQGMLAAGNYCAPTLKLASGV
jgi:hypothetical protein